MVIRQGDLYWVDLDEPRGAEPGYRRPVVVIQNNLFNQSRIRTVVVCAITSDLKRAAAPGNVLLKAGEGGLPKASVVLVSQIFTLDKRDLSDHMGTLSPRRVRQILDGVRLVLEPRDVS